MRKPFRPLCFQLLLLLAATSVAPAQGAPPKRFFWTAGLAGQFPCVTAFRDTDPDRRPPTPLYGRGYEAAGDFTATPAPWLGLGYRCSRWLRLEGRAEYLPRLNFSGESNFLPPDTPEPVTGRGRALAILGGAVLELAPLTGRLPLGLEPYLRGSLGPCLTWQGPVVLSYPTLAIPHTLTTPPGMRTSLAWRVGAGISRRMAKAVTLDVEYTYTRYGVMYTEEGDALRYRPTTGQATIIPIGATEAVLQAHGISTGVRWEW